MRVGIEYQPAVTHAPGVGRYARELVRALVRLEDAPELRLLELGREAAVVGEDALGLQDATSRVVRRRLRLPRRAGRWLGRIGLGADRLLLGVDLYHHVRLPLDPVSSARATMAVSELPAPGDPAAGELGRALGRLAGVFVFSRRYRERLEEEFGLPGHRIHEVPVGADHWIRDLPPRVEPESPPVVLVLGAPRPERGHGVVLDACERLWKGGRELTLRVVGPRRAADPAFFSAVERSPARARIDWREPDERELPAIVATASVLVHLNRAEEGTAVTLLEALATGVAVLASEQPAFAEAASGVARLLPPEHAFDPARLADRIDEALMEFRDGSAIAARRAVGARFTWEENARATLAAWKRILGESG